MTGRVSDERLAELFRIRNTATVGDEWFQNTLVKMAAVDSFSDLIEDLQDARTEIARLEAHIEKIEQKGYV